MDLENWVLLYVVVVLLLLRQLRMKCFCLFDFSPSYSSVPAVQLITIVYITVVRTRQCVCMREAWEELHYYSSCFLAD